MFGSRRQPIPWVSLLCAAAGVLAASGARAEGQHEFLLFPSVDATHVWDRSTPETADSDERAALDLVYGFTGERTRFFGEFLASSDESEFERLQVGWALSDHTMLWLGRFHSPSSFWIGEFHHGQYMQTSITRPSLEEWEDESGATPAHLTGLNLEYRRELKDSAALEFALGAGLAPKFVEDHLEPFDLFDPTSGHGTSIGFRATYKPSMFDPVQLGVVSSWHEINVEPGAVPGLADLDRIDQLSLGMFADVQWGDVRLIASAVFYSNKLQYVDSRLTDKYLMAYVQPEYSITDSVTVFGRVDIGHKEDDSLYLTFLPAFIAHRNMLGIRWDFARRQAVTLEVADTSKQGNTDNHDSFKELRLQWSAVIR